MCDNAIKSVGNAIRNVTGKISEALRPIDPIGSAVVDRADEQTKHWDESGTSKYIGAAALAYATAGASLGATEGAAAAGGTATAGGAATAAGGAATAAGGAATVSTAAQVAGAIKTGAGLVATAGALNNALNPRPVPAVPVVVPMYSGGVQSPGQLPDTATQAQGGTAPAGTGNFRGGQAQSENASLPIIAAAVIGGFLLWRMNHVS